MLKPAGKRKRQSFTQMAKVCELARVLLERGNNQVGALPRKKPARKFMGGGWAMKERGFIKGSLKALERPRIWRNETRASVPALSHRLGTLTRPSAKIERHERRRHA